MKTRFLDLIGRSTTRKTRSERGAGGVEYALALGLIAVVALAALLGVGGKVRDIFSNADEQIALDGHGGGSEGPGGPGGDSGDLPIVTVTSSSSTVAFNQQVTIDWTAENAFSVTSSYTLSGNCNTLSTFGSGPHDVTPLAGTIGTLNVDWTADLAGCDYELTISADNEAGTNFMARTVAIAMLDVTPENLAFADTLGVEPGALAQSAPATIADVDVGATVSVSDADAGVSSGSGFASSQTVGLGGQVSLRASAPSGFDQQRLVPFQAGSLAGNWRIQTRAQDITPNTFSIAPVAGAAPSAAASSSPVTVTGFDGPLTITASNGGEVAVGGGSFGASGSINPGQSFVAKQTASSAFSGTASTTISVGNTSADFVVTTREQDTTPDAFTIASVTDVARNTVTTSTPVAITGFDGQVLVFISSGTAQVSVDGTDFGSARTLTAGPNAQVWVRMTSSPNYNTPLTATVNVGSSSATWTVTTQPDPSTQIFNAFCEHGFENGTNPTIVGTTYGTNLTDAQCKQAAYNAGDQVWNRRTNTGGGGSPTTSGYCRGYNFLPLNANSFNCNDKWNYGATGR